MAHIAGYLHAAAGAAAATPDDAGAGGSAPDHAAAQPPMFLCDGRATTARQASARVSALAAALVQRLGMQVWRRCRGGCGLAWCCCCNALVLSSLLHKHANPRPATCPL